MTEQSAGAVSRDVLKVVYEPTTACNSRWAKIQHRCPLRDSPHKGEFIILSTETERLESLSQQVTQVIEIRGNDVAAVSDWLKKQPPVESVSET